MKWPGEEQGHRFNIAVVDDEPNNILLFKVALTTGPFEIDAYSSGVLFLEGIKEGKIPDLVLLDVMMPEMDGFQVCEQLRENPKTSRIPVILVTGLDDTQYIIQGLDVGADDYITKPFHPRELMARMRALLRVSLLTGQLEKKNLMLADDKVHLEELVRERTTELEDLTMGLVASLERANEMNDSDTGLHIMRVMHYSALLAETLGLEKGLVNKIRRFASLHDVGKVGIPDDILKKPGTLTKEEFDRMKEHTTFGYELLRLAKADPVALNIALHHHEKFNGKGYPNGAAAADIPIEARVVAVADVFDALTTPRVYKAPYDLEKSRSIIIEEGGEHFDPRLVEIFGDCWDGFQEIFATYGDK